MVDSDLDLSILEVLDFEYAPPCEVKGGCEFDATAAWRIVTGCCGEVILICEKHKKVFVDDAIEIVAKRPWLMLECNYCGVSGIPINKFFLVIEKI